MKRQKWLAQVLTGLACLVVVVRASAQSPNFADEPACHTLQPASAGGPLRKSPDVLVLRYFSYASFEVAYQGRVLLLDAYYDNSHPTDQQLAGIKESDITRAAAIIVGHTHFDHFEDAPAIAKRTGAPIFIAPPGLNCLRAQNVPENQIHILSGGETVKQSGYTLQSALGIHMVVPSDVASAYRDFIAKSNPLSSEQQKWLASHAASPTPDVAIDPLDPNTDTTYHGTIVYVLTFDSGFRLLFSDSDGILSNGEEVLADSTHPSGGKIDLAILGYLGDSLEAATRTTLLRVNTWKPSIFVPSHFHNGDTRVLPEMPTAPLFEAFRTGAPGTRGIEPLYRSPICVDTKNDEFFVGNYVN